MRRRHFLPLVRATRTLGREKLAPEPCISGLGRQGTGATRCIPLAGDANTYGFRLSMRWSSAEADGNRGERTGGPSSTEATNGSSSTEATSGSSSTEGASPSSTPQDGPLALYESLVASQQLRADPRQCATAARLQELYDSLVKGRVGEGGGPSTASAPSRPSGLTMTRAVSTPPPRTWLSSLLGSFTPSEASPPPPPPKGLYMFGGVGVGKTMVMDLFVQALRTQEPAQRIHFHDFMLSVHQSLRVHSRVPDPLREVARDVLASGRVLCLDELFVTDVADASILNRLFALLWEGGLVLTATSNRAPDALYEGGLQRDLFLPFIHALHARCAVHDMESDVDHRRLARARGGRYVLDPGGAEEVEARFAEAAGSAVPAPESLPVAMGRELLLHRAVPGAALARFPELCARALGAADYIALASAKHSLFLSSVPRFEAATLSQAYRFVTLVDVLYEHRVRLTCSAEAPPDALFAAVLTPRQARELRSAGAALPKGAAVDANLGFAKDRTVSRLVEMQSAEYELAWAELWKERGARAQE